jgi:hypothetical protein
MAGAQQPKLTPIDLYTVLMHEARSRIEALNFILAGQTKLAEAIVRELCWLQIRMLCETIALGCLVAHGDLVASQFKKFEKEYAADKIIKMMEALNPHFFPQQATFSRESETRQFNITANTNANALKKSELSHLYRRCGEMLHRGRFEAVLATDPFKHGKLDVREIVSWAQKIEDLLGSHIIPLTASATSATMLTCVLRDATRNFQTTVNRLELSRQFPTS